MTPRPPTNLASRRTWPMGNAALRKLLDDVDLAALDDETAELCRDLDVELCLAHERDSVAPALLALAADAGPIPARLATAHDTPEVPVPYYTTPEGRIVHDGQSDHQPAPVDRAGEQPAATQALLDRVRTSGRRHPRADAVADALAARPELTGSRPAERADIVAARTGRDQPTPKPTPTPTPGYTADGIKLAQPASDPFAPTWGQQQHERLAASHTVAASSTSRQDVAAFFATNPHWNKGGSNDRRSDQEKLDQLGRSFVSTEQQTLPPGYNPEGFRVDAFRQPLPDARRDSPHGLGGPQTRDDTYQDVVEAQRAALLRHRQAGRI